MLTGYQCETVAFTFNGEIICPDCAVAATSAITVAKAERGLAHGFSDLSPLSRYSLDEYASESAWEYASQEAEEGTPEFDEIFERASIQSCGDCGREID